MSPDERERLLQQVRSEQSSVESATGRAVSVVAGEVAETATRVSKKRAPYDKVTRLDADTVAYERDTDDEIDPAVYGTPAGLDEFMSPEEIATMLDQDREGVLAAVRDPEAVLAAEAKLLRSEGSPSSAAGGRKARLAVEDQAKQAALVSAGFRGERGDMLAARREDGGVAASKARVAAGLQRAAQQGSISFQFPDTYPLTQWFAEELPVTVPKAADGMRWQWLPAIHSGVQVPTGWRRSFGRGLFIDTEMDMLLCSADGEGAEFKVGMEVRRYAPASASELFSQPPMEIARTLASQQLTRLGQTDPEQLPGESQEAYLSRVQEMQRSGERLVAPDIVDSWQGEIHPGVHSFGLEFIMPHTDFPDDPITHSGFQCCHTVVVSLVDDMVFEAAFKAPARVWQPAWNEYGRHMLDDACFNWHDASPYKYTTA